MNPAHIHLMLNHAPLFGVLAGVIVLAVSLVMRRPGVARAGFVVFVLTALLAVSVYLTGEPAEELVENLPGVSETVMETHEETALVATVALGTFGLLALYGLFASRHGGTLRFPVVALLLSLVPLAAMGYTAYLGGQIRHSEIRSPALDSGGQAGAAQEAEEEEDDGR